MKKKEVHSQMTTLLQSLYVPFHIHHVQPHNILEEQVHVNKF